MVDGAAQAVRKDGEGFALAVLAREAVEILLRWLIAAQEPHGGLRERPLEEGVADLLAEYP